MLCLYIYLLTLTFFYAEQGTFSVSFNTITEKREHGKEIQMTETAGYEKMFKIQFSFKALVK